MCPSLIQIGSKTAEKNSAQTNRQTNRHYENNGHLAVNQQQNGIRRDGSGLQRLGLESVVDVAEVWHVVLLQNDDLGQCRADAECTVHTVNKVLAVVTRAASQREEHVEHLHLVHSHQHTPPSTASSNNSHFPDAHTYEQTNSSLDWVLSHWAHFTVLRFIFVLCITVCCMHA